MAKAINERLIFELAADVLTKKVKIATCQLNYIHRDIKRATDKIIEMARKADLLGAKIVCFPECFLQGYVFDCENVFEHGLELSSPAFEKILKATSSINSAIIVGLIEKRGKELFNTAVVIHKGKLLGSYSKVNLLKGESMFTAGRDYPVFEIDEVRFGINICFDLNFPDSARNIAEQNAMFLMCPCNNMMESETAEKWKNKHNESRMSRAKENSIWVISSDVTGKWRDRISYGPTAFIDPKGKVVEQAKLLEESLVIHEVEPVCTYNSE